MQLSDPALFRFLLQQNIAEVTLKCGNKVKIVVECLGPCIDILPQVFKMELASR